MSDAAANPAADPAGATASAPAADPLFGGGAPAPAAPAGSPAEAPTADPAPSKWYEGLSADAPDEKTLSDRAWAENKAYATPADQIKAHRELERAFVGGDKLVLPKDLSDPKAMAPVWDRLGRPADAKGYDLPVPEGSDPAFAGKFAEAAHKAGMPASMAKAAVDWWNGEAKAAADALVARNTSEQTAMRSEWGKDFEGNVATVNAAATRFGLTPELLATMRDAIGPKATAAHLLAIGKAMGEHGLEGGGARPMGLTPETAKARKAEIFQDKALMASISNKSNPAAVAEWNAINAVMAEAEERERRAA